MGNSVIQKSPSTLDIPDKTSPSDSIKTTAPMNGDFVLASINSPLMIY
jgi:hypothetical protein